MNDVATESPEKFEATSAGAAAVAETPVAPAVVPVVTPVAVVPVNVLGAAGSIVRPDTSGELAATVAQCPARGAIIVLRDESDAQALQELLRASGKRCRYSVNKKQGPRSLWRNVAE